MTKMDSFSQSFQKSVNNSWGKSRVQYIYWQHTIEIKINRSLLFHLSWMIFIKYLLYLDEGSCPIKNSEVFWLFLSASTKYWISLIKESKLVSFLEIISIICLSLLTGLKASEVLLNNGVIRVYILAEIAIFWLHSRNSQNPSQLRIQLAPLISLYKARIMEKGLSTEKCSLRNTPLVLIWPAFMHAIIPIM